MCEKKKTGLWIFGQHFETLRKLQIALSAPFAMKSSEQVPAHQVQQLDRVYFTNMSLIAKFVLQCFLAPASNSHSAGKPLDKKKEHNISIKHCLGQTNSVFSKNSLCLTLNF